ncbi:MAG: RusA family crossover junction endodeoxyribonuclease [Geobacteraceae bacterium]|nr:RusA family crossover junction endodeoxyribonuclease [Geobacteraceae bacterium]
MTKRDMHPSLFFFMEGLNHEPPDNGTIEISLMREPVSLQANRVNKDALKQEIQLLTTQTKYLLVGDLRVDVIWRLSEQERYETDASADVDNIIKPILDALGGITGLFVDDCQVQFVSCHWFDGPPGAQETSIKLSFSPQEWMTKEGIVFVHMGRGLCMPFDISWGKEGNVILLDKFIEMIRLRDNCLKETGDYYRAMSLLPTSRIFHRTRVNDFKVIEPLEFRQMQWKRIRSSTEA